MNQKRLGPLVLQVREHMYSTRHMSFATQGAPWKRVFAHGTAQGCSLVIQKWWMLMRWFGSKSSFGGSMPCMSGSFCWDMMDVQVKSSKGACKNSKSSQDETAKRETLGAIFPYIRTIDWTSCWYFTWYLPWCQISRHHEKHLIFAQPRQFEVLIFTVGTGRWRPPWRLWGSFGRLDKKGL